MMYKLLKSAFNSLLPSFLRKKIRSAARKGLAKAYSGDKHTCAVCRARLARFIREDNKLICPACGSLERHRKLITLLDEYMSAGKTILDFSPNEGFAKRMKHDYGADYIRTEYDRKKEADTYYDITAMACDDNIYDIIICYHVFEHIRDDKEAMAELYRVLKRDGVMFAQTPFREGSIYEDGMITSPAERLKHFGQEDHVRVYSREGLAARLESAGFAVDIRDEDILVCIKQ